MICAAQMKHGFAADSKSQMEPVLAPSNGTDPFVYFVLLPICRRSAVDHRLDSASRLNFCRKTTFHPHECSFCTTLSFFVRFFTTRFHHDKHWPKPLFSTSHFLTYRSVSRFKVAFIAFILN